MNKIYFLTLFLCLSCTKYVEFNENSGIAYLKKFEGSIESVKVEDWKVGAGRIQSVSKGFAVNVNLTPIEEEHALIMAEKYHINSWVARITKVDGPYRKEIGYCYNPFFVGHHRKGKSFVKIKNISFRINYAASLTKNMRSHTCPPHDHNLEISEANIIDQNFGNYTVSTNSGRVLQKPVERNQIVPPTFNGGMKLQGKYRIDLALYNSQTRKIYGDWIPAKGIIHIVYEKQKTISGCAGKSPKIKNGRSDKREMPTKLWD